MSKPQKTLFSINLDVVKISVKIFRLNKISSSARQAIIVFHKCFLIHIKVADVNHMLIYLKVYLSIIKMYQCFVYIYDRFGED